MSAQYPMQLVEWFPTAALIKHMPQDEEEEDYDGPMQPLQLDQIKQWASTHADDLDSKGNNGLHWCCVYDQPQAMATLLEHNADVATLNDEMYSPLHVACSSNSPECCRLLLDAKASVDVQNENGEYPLHAACLNNSAQCVELLLAQKADCSATDKYGATAVHIACYYDAVECLKLLLGTADPASLLKMQDQKGFTPLMWCCHGNAARSAEYLCTGAASSVLTAHIGVVASAKQSSAFHRAAFMGGVEVIAPLLAGIQECKDVPFTINTKNNDGDTALIIACYKNYWSFVKVLFQQSARLGHEVDINAVNNAGEGAIHWACLHNSVLVLSELLRQPSADVNLQDQNGNSGLHIAWQHDSWECAEQLLSYPCRVDFNLCNQEQSVASALASPEGRDTFDDLARKAYSKGLQLMDTDPQHAQYEHAKALHLFQHRVVEKFQLLGAQRYKAKVFGLKGKKKTRDCALVLGLRAVLVSRATSSFVSGKIKVKTQTELWNPHSVVSYEAQENNVVLDMKGDGSILITLTELERDEAHWLYSVLVMVSLLHAYLWGTTRLRHVQNKCLAFYKQMKAGALDNSALATLKDKLVSVDMKLSRIHQRLLITTNNLHKLAEIQAKSALAANTPEKRTEYSMNNQELLDAAAVCDIEAYGIVHTQKEISDRLQWLESKLTFGDEVPKLVPFVKFSAPRGDYKGASVEHKAQTPTSSDQQASASSMKPTKLRRASHLMVRHAMFRERSVAAPEESSVAGSVFARRRRSALLLRLPVVQESASQLEHKRVNKAARRRSALASMDFKDADSGAVSISAAGPTVSPLGLRVVKPRWVGFDDDDDNGDPPPLPALPPS